ncbi:GNAT family N-acetyltransferase [Cupriavidus sp. L7L]|uniref:GNAT family N-acetyltransferase n=1 Tax=Cupriavidus sp. L7L TaxID=2546443 RepID=UPI001055D5E5|nr:GNAT family N-acetyltransferase [Cupriavidus sp. L7L]TDF62801.1 GNAT family N-acetyltransferase [Cupriavidus sp. L7L]
MNSANGIASAATDLVQPTSDPSRQGDADHHPGLNAPAASGATAPVRQVADTEVAGNAAQARYRQLCNTANIPLFSQAWWLDATAGPGNWSVALVERGGQIVASLPYAPRRMYGFSVIAQPALAKMSGPWLAPMDGKPARVLGQQKELMDDLIGQLPRFDHFQQHWDPGQTNWLPFAWKGFRQTTKYTYVFDDLSDPEALWNGMQHNIRAEIRKAGSRHGLQVRDDLGIDEFIKLNRQVFSRQRMAIPYTDDFVRRLDAACAARGARKFFIAVDKEGRRHAGVYLVWDGRVAYYLMGGSDPLLRTSGATSLCMWEAIRYASGVARTFDFEGSMLEPVERFFRAFGARQQPYFFIQKTPSRILLTYLYLRSLLNP